MDELANPFRDAAALENSHYSAFQNGRVIDPTTGELRPALTRFVHDALRSLVLNDQFPCVGGKSAVRQGAYRFGLYDQLGSPAAAAGLARDLFTFTRELNELGGPFSTYLASFRGPVTADEEGFERLLWHALQQLHDLDAAYHSWDPSVSSDANDAHFSFSLAGVAFFVVGLHAASSRATRRFAWPTLVMNPHAQFDGLKASGQFARFQEVIRRGDLELQGQINPMLAEHGQKSEAVQYSGRHVEAEWRCPFHAHSRAVPVSANE
jgi:FPC/CPF motif-containing protein YcgG